MISHIASKNELFKDNKKGFEIGKHFFFEDEKLH